MLWVDASLCNCSLGVGYGVLCSWAIWPKEWWGIPAEQPKPSPQDTNNSVTTEASSQYNWWFSQVNYCSNIQHPIKSWGEHPCCYAPCRVQAASSTPAPRAQAEAQPEIHLRAPMAREAAPAHCVVSTPRVCQGPEDSNAPECLIPAFSRVLPALPTAQDPISVPRAITFCPRNGTEQIVFSSSKLGLPGHGLWQEEPASDPPQKSTFVTKSHINKQLCDVYQMKVQRDLNRNPTNSFR